MEMSTSDESPGCSGGSVIQPDPPNSQDGPNETMSSSSSSTVSPKVTPRKSKPGKQEQTPRVKLYPDGAKGPWVVFFRPKAKALNCMQISRDLAKQFPTVTEILKVRPNKLRVTAQSLKQANDIASFKLFTLEYRVYVPARVVEIDGVVTERGLTVDQLLKSGIGRFKDSALQPVKILDCKQLHSVSFDNGVKNYTPSDSFRVTFAGSALPSHIDVDRVRLPVRLFVPRVMNCLNCKQLGHTASFCCNKARCGHCGENHEDSACNKGSEMCLYCGGTPHELSTCPSYKLRGEKIKRSLKERSKRSYAEMLKKAAVATSTLVSSNPYDVLSSDESDLDDPLGDFSYVKPIVSRKRKISSPLLPRKESKVSPSGMKHTLEPNCANANPKQTPPGFVKINSRKEFPALPGTSKTPAVPFVSSKIQPESGLLKFSEIVDWLFETFNIADPLKSLLLAFLPTVRTFLKQLTAKWPLISTIVSFDG